MNLSATKKMFSAWEVKASETLEAMKTARTLKEWFRLNRTLWEYIEQGVHVDDATMQAAYARASELETEEK